MAERNDQVFQLSLTEIAFTITFLLMLLLGYKVVKEQSDRMAAEAELAKLQSTKNVTSALEAAKISLTNSLKGAGVLNPEEVITKLVAAEETRGERDRLKEKVDDLDAKLTALSELQRRVEKAAISSKPDITKQEIDSAMALQEQVRQAMEREESIGRAAGAYGGSLASSSASPPNLPASVATAKSSIKDKAITTDFSVPSAPHDSPESRNKRALDAVKQALVATGELKQQLKQQLDRELKRGDEERTVRDVVAAAKSYNDIAKSGSNPEIVRKENSDLRGQVAFLKNRLDARGGRDFPPCWADESGKVEFLFSIETKPDSVSINPAWPSIRESAARGLPGIAEALAGPHTNQVFVLSIQEIFNWSKKQNPECRHYVQLRSSIADAVQSDRARLMIERYFYKVEARR